MKANGIVEIKLDRTRRLKFDFNSYCRIEQALGRELSPENMKGLSAARALLYGGLLWEDPAMTLERAGKFFDDFDMGYIMGKVGEAMTAANPDVKDADPNAPRPEAGTGALSSSKPAA